MPAGSSKRSSAASAPLARVRSSRARGLGAQADADRPIAASQSIVWASFPWGSFGRLRSGALGVDRSATCRPKLQYLCGSWVRLVFRPPARLRCRGEAASGPSSAGERAPGSPSRSAPPPPPRRWEPAKRPPRSCGALGRPPFPGSPLRSAPTLRRRWKSAKRPPEVGLERKAPVAASRGSRAFALDGRLVVMLRGLPREDRLAAAGPGARRSAKVEPFQAC